MTYHDTILAILGGIGGAVIVIACGPFSPPTRHGYQPRDGGPPGAPPSGGSSVKRPTPLDVSPAP